MSSEIKPGLYAVEVTAKAHPLSTTTTPSPAVWLTSADFGTWRIPADCLHPLPAATISAEAQAVMDAAVKWRNAYGLLNAIANATDAYRATLTPPDPVAELRRVAAMFCICPEEWAGEFDAALAAVEAARVAK